MEHLKNRDYVLVIDRSGSMGTTDCKGGKSRWDWSRETVEALATKISGYDPDGITVYMFGSQYKKYDGVRGSAEVSRIYNEVEPAGGTELVPVLQAVFNDYLTRKKSGFTKPNGETLLVVTDGAPGDQNQVAKTIVNFANSLDNADSEYGISFLQVGHDKTAAEFLKRLDDNLTSEGAKHDIVDTKTFDEVEELGFNQILQEALTG